MSVHEFTPVVIAEHEVRQDKLVIVASVTVAMYLDEALKLAVGTSYAVRPGDRCSPPMSLRTVGATLAEMEA